MVSVIHSFFRSHIADSSRIVAKNNLNEILANIVICFKFRFVLYGIECVDSRKCRQCIFQTNFKNLRKSRKRIFLRPI